MNRLDVSRLPPRRGVPVDNVMARRLESGLVAHWPLDELTTGTRRDTGGAGLTLTNNNATTGLVNGGPLGRIPHASVTDGVNQSLSSTAAALYCGDFDRSYSGWIRPDSIPAGASIYGFCGQFDGSTTFRIYVNGTTGAVILQVRDAADTADAFISSAALSVFTAGAWSYWAFGHDSVNNLMYLTINATTVSSAYTAGLRATGGSFSIGSENPAGGNPFPGRLASTSVWNRLVLPAEHAYLYNKGAGRYLVKGRGYL